MKSKIDIADIQLTQLNSACLVWISKFARALKDHDGTIIRMQDSNVIGQIVEHAHKTNDADLRHLYRSLKHEIRNLINSEHFDKRSLSKFVIPSTKSENINKQAR